jgi:pseudouridine-5'-monophosphatase
MCATPKALDPRQDLPKGALFDLDGVLLDTEPFYTEATQTVVGEFGKMYTWDIKRRIMGGTAQRGADIVVAELELPISSNEYLMRRRRILEQLFRNTPAIPGAEALVRRLSALGMPMAIATSSERTLFELKSRNHDWFALFSAVVCGDDPRLSNPKPAPDIFLLAAAEIGLDASACVAFEDSPTGVRGAAASGAYVIARRDPALRVEELSAAHRVVEQYDELDLPEALCAARLAR